MKVSKIRQGIVLVVVAGTLGLGCELIVDFDRTKIPIESSDTGAPSEAGAIDAPIDTFVPDTSTPDGATESDAGDGGDGDADVDADAG